MGDLSAGSNPDPSPGQAKLCSKPSPSPLGAILVVPVFQVLGFGPNCEPQPGMQSERGCWMLAWAQTSICKLLFLFYTTQKYPRPMKNFESKVNARAKAAAT